MLNMWQLQTDLCEAGSMHPVTPCQLPPPPIPLPSANTSTFSLSIPHCLASFSIPLHLPHFTLTSLHCTLTSLTVPSNPLHPSLMAPSNPSSLQRTFKFFKTHYNKWLTRGHIISLQNFWSYCVIFGNALVILGTGLKINLAIKGVRRQI